MPYPASHLENDGRSREHLCMVLRRALRIMLVCLLTATSARAAVAHPSSWYWSNYAAQTALIEDDICNDGAACKVVRDVVAASCSGRMTNPTTGRKDWIWSKDRSKRLYRHFACAYTYSNGAAWKGMLHVLGKEGWEIQNATLVRRAGSPIPPPPPPRPTPPPPPPPSAGGSYLGVGGGHWIRDVIERGRLLRLEDGSLWKIGPLDYIDSILWMKLDDITVLEGGFYGYRLLNEDNAEIVEATFLGYG
jgi:hypothetical protein